MGQLTVGILFFKSPRPTGWLGEIGVRHWPHRFPSCGLNQLWLLPSLSPLLSFSLSHSAATLFPSFSGCLSLRFVPLSLSLSPYLSSLFPFFFLSRVGERAYTVDEQRTILFYSVSARISRDELNIVRELRDVDWTIRNCGNVSLDNGDTEAAHSSLPVLLSTLLCQPITIISAVTIRFFVFDRKQSPDQRDSDPWMIVSFARQICCIVSDEPPQRKGERWEKESLDRW